MMTAEKISLVLAGIGFCFGLLICVILLLANKAQVHANRLLALTVLGLTMAMLQAVLIYSGFLIEVPHFFRIPSPFFYLSLSTGFLYLRAVINDETKFQKFDFIFFLPTGLHILELLPFYLKSSLEKKLLITELLQHPGQIVQMNEGLLPPYLHNLIRATIGTVFLVFMIRFLIKAYREGRSEIRKSAIFNWLKWYTTLMGLMVIAILSILLIPQSVHLDKTFGVNLAVIICFVIMSFFLFFRPQILYGLPRLRMERLKFDYLLPAIPPPADLHVKALQQVEQSTIGQQATVARHSSLDYLLAYKPALEMHLQTSKPYLQQGYNIGKLSMETGIPQHHLSALLNKVYGVRFNDFVNQYRIQHITDYFHQSDWSQLTLEGIATEVGFNSRTTFFNAIKKSTGLAPSEYINQIKVDKMSGQNNITTTPH